jgi:DNA-binding MarR family transcriptional regulator
MKITVGEITIEVDNDDEISQAVGVIRELNGDAKAIRQAKNRQDSMKEAAIKIDTGTGELNQIQYRTWQYLVDNDAAGGIHVSQLAHAFGITNGSANGRLTALLKMGYASREAKGYYKAVTP